MARARKAVEEEHENYERWLLTYSDMITLLMVLFIVLFAISQIDNTKFKALHDGLAQQFGTPVSVLNSNTGLLPDNAKPTAPDLNLASAAPASSEQQALQTAARVEAERMDQVKRQIETALRKSGLQNSVEFRVEARRLVISVVTDEVLFELGSADLRPQGRTLLDGLGPALAGVPNAIGVEGHTDNLPITGARFPSNWELSTARATTVVRYLADVARLAPSQLSASGYADQRPVAPNDTTANRARNRRVEVVVLSTLRTAADGPAAVASEPATTPLAGTAATPAIDTPIGAPVGNPIGSPVTASKEQN